MTASTGDNRASRDAILGRVRKAIGRTGSDAQARADAEAYIAAHAQGPRPAMPVDLVEHRPLHAGFAAAWPHLKVIVEASTVPDDLRYGPVDDGDGG